MTRTVPSLLEHGVYLCTMCCITASTKYNVLKLLYLIKEDFHYIKHLWTHIWRYWLASYITILNTFGTEGEVCYSMQVMYAMVCVYYLMFRWLLNSRADSPQISQSLYIYTSINTLLYNHYQIKYIIVNGLSTKYIESNNNSYNS